MSVFKLSAWSIPVLWLLWALYWLASAAAVKATQRVESALAAVAHPAADARRLGAGDSAPADRVAERADISPDLLALSGGRGAGRRRARFRGVGAGPPRTQLERQRDGQGRPRAHRHGTLRPRAAPDLHRADPRADRLRT